MSLKKATMELHHAAEMHAVGDGMARGTIPLQWWADWCSALYIIHSVIDAQLPASMVRAPELLKDLVATGLRPRPMMEAIRYAKTLTTKARCEGAAYVFTGAHLMGGAITAKNNKDRLPCHHLTWKDRPQSVLDWKPLRQRDDLEEPAYSAFQTVLSIMDEIVRQDGGHETNTMQ